MAENKKYYYLKLKDNFFDSEEIKVLESMPNGKLYAYLLIKLYLISLKSSGALRFNETIPYDENLIATVTNLNIRVVRSGLKVLYSMKLIEKLDDGTIYMTNIQNFIGKSSSEADRKRQYREEIEEEKKLTGQVMDKCPTDDKTILDKHSREIEIEKDIEIELEKERETEKKDKSDIVPQTIYLLSYFKNLTGLQDGLNIIWLKEAVAVHGAENVRMAIENAVTMKSPNMKYINGILKNWANEGYPYERRSSDEGFCSRDYGTS